MNSFGADNIKNSISVSDQSSKIEKDETEYSSM